MSDLRDGVRTLGGLGAAVAGHEEEVLRCARTAGPARPGEVLRDTRLHRTVALAGPAGEPRILKWHGGRPPLDLWRDVFSGRAFVPAARIEFENLRALAAQGFPVPQALGWGRSPGGGSFLLLRPVEGSPLDAWMRSAVDPATRRGILAAVASLVSRFHRAGWFHRDLYACHLLVDGSQRLALIDLARARRTRRLRARWIVKDLGALLHSTRDPSTSLAERARFLLEYLGKDRLDREARRLAARVLRRAERMRRHVPREG
jgi:heptose I phosphotransferase